MKSLFRAALPLLVSISAFAAPCGKWGLNPNTGRFDCVGTGGSGTGTVTSVSFTGGIISVANPTTTPAFTVAATSGGVVYGVDATHWGFSGAMASGQFMLGGGAGSPPTTSFSVVPVASGGTSFSSYTKGDTICPSAATTFIKLGVGSDGLVLTADAASTCGIKWAAAGSASYSAGNGLTLTSTTFSIDTTITLDTVTAQSITGKKTFVKTANVAAFNLTPTTVPSSSLAAGDCYINSTTFNLGCYNGSAFQNILSTTATPPTATEVVFGSSTSGLTTVVASTGTGSVVRASGATIGTPAQLALTNALDCPVATCISGFGTGISTFLATPSSANLAAAVTDELGSGKLIFSAGTLAVASGKTLTVSNTLTLTGTDSSSIAFGGGGTAVKLIASGAKALATSAISSGACSSAQTDTATGAATTDSIVFTFSADPTSTTGYAPTTSGGLFIYAYPTSNTVNFKVCNNTSASVTPGAATLNWLITRSM